VRESVGGDDVALWQVEDLDRFVDRDALLRGDDAPDPPYWAHLWSGARVLAAAVPAGAGRGIELGCGLGLPGVTAARRGTRMLCTDRVAAPLSYVRASAAANGVRGLEVAVMDAMRPACGGAFDLVLAAELLYERPLFGTLAGSLRLLLAPGGRGLLTDGRRIDTTAFYRELEQAGLAWHGRDVPIEEEGVTVRVRLVEFRRVEDQSPWRAILR
jgi:predicted nicotinamide N-methyase